MDRIIFLDFDGVVNNFGDVESLRKLSSENVGNLNTLVECSDAFIVISSTWRIYRSITVLRQILPDAGFKYPAKVVDKTIRNGGWCGTEIDDWLKRNPEVIQFVILDDDSDMEPHMSNLVQTDCENGLTENDVKKALSILGV